MLALAAACGETERLAPPTLTRTVAAATTSAATASPRTTAPTATAAPTTPAPTTAAPTQSATARTPSPTPSLAGTATPSFAPTTAPASPTAPPTLPVSLPAMPALPALAVGVKVIESRSIVFTIPPGVTHIFDASIALQAPPPCPSFVWVAAWRATDPVVATVRSQASAFDIGRGRWGTADMSCSWVELRNDTSTTITGEFAYQIGSR